MFFNKVSLFFILFLIIIIIIIIIIIYSLSTCICSDDQEGDQREMEGTV